MISCKFEDGKVANPSLRHVVVDALVIKNDKILLVKRAKALLEGGKWALIGGFLGINETIEQAVRREIFEETGYNVDNLKLLRVKDSPNRPGEDRQNISFVFICSALDKKGKHDWEVIEEKWFLFSNLPPKEQIAFDHYQDIMLYQRAIFLNLSLPLI